VPGAAHRCHAVNAAMRASRLTGADRHPDRRADRSLATREEGGGRGVEAWKLERSTREGKRVGTGNFRDRGCYGGRERGERGAGFSAVAKALQGVTCLLFFQLLGEFVVGWTAILSPLFHLTIIFSTNQTFFVGKSAT
jgi:hypothetical protein